MPDLWDEKASQRLGDKAESLIAQRTAAGVAADGRPFRPLATGEATDLRDTGRLMSSIQVTATPRGARVEATTDYAIFVQARRPFMGLTDSDLKELDREAEAALDELERQWRQASWG